MYVACSTLCFGQSPLAEALKKARMMGFVKAELSLAGRPTDSIDPAAVAAAVRGPNVTVTAVAAAPGDDPEKSAEIAARLARQLAAPVLVVSAGRAGGDFDDEVRRLTRLSQISARQGLLLAAETHSEQITADPLGAAELCRRVPGLGLALDPSHYLIGDHKAESLEPLYPHTYHVRLRDTGTGPGQLQVRVGRGKVEYGRIINQLARSGYRRALCVDVRDEPGISFPVEPEVRKLRFLLESLL